MMRESDAGRRYPCPSSNRMRCISGRRLSNEHVRAVQDKSAITRHQTETRCTGSAYLDVFGTEKGSCSNGQRQNSCKSTISVRTVSLQRRLTGDCSLTSDSAKRE